MIPGALFNSSLFIVYVRTFLFSLNDTALIKLALSARVPISNGYDIPILKASAFIITVRSCPAAIVLS